MGGFSPVHMGLVLVIALLVFGPKKLPEIGRELGQAIREFKKASREVMEGFHEAAEERPYAPPAYDSYASAAERFAIAPHDTGVAEGPALPAGPPPGAVERGAAEAPHVEATPVSPAAEPPAAPEAATHEPAPSPAAAERNP